MTTRHHRVAAHIARLGEMALVYSRASSGTNSFGNTEWTFDSDPDGDGTDTEVLCLRSYDNRNTEVQQNSGDRHRDNPLFLIPIDEWEKVDADDRLGYPEPTGGRTMYELQAPTVYSTHVEIFGEAVSN